MVINDSHKLHRSFDDYEKAFSCFNFLSRPICIIDPDSIDIVYTNASFASLFGKTTDLLGKSFLDLFVQAEQSEIKQVLQQTAEGRAVELEKLPTYDDNHFSKFKSFFRLYRTPSTWGNCIVSEFCWIHPNYLESVAAIISDPLMLDARNSTIQEYKTQLYSIVHELNNSFSVLISNRDILEIYLNRIDENLSANNIKLGQKAEKALSESLDILEDNRKVLTILSELLKTSQNFLQRESYKLQVLNVKEIVEAVVESLYKSFQVHPRVSIAIADDLRIYANLSHVTILLKNIILNAFQACEGVETCKVHIAGSQSEGYTTITVNDSGIGMTGEILSTIFDSYTTTKEKQGNLGIGLTICHDIVKNYKGSIEIQSTEGKGTTVKIKIPTHHSN